MTWFAFQGLNNGQAIDLAGSQEKQAVIEGFHGYATKAQAQAKPNSVNFLTRYQADGFIADYKAAVAGKEQPGGSNATITNPSDLAKGTADQAANLGSAAAASVASGLVKWISQSSIWERAAEVVGGLLILYVGVKAMVTPAGQAPAKQTFKSTASRIAGAAVKVAK